MLRTSQCPAYTVLLSILIITGLSCGKAVSTPPAEAAPGVEDSSAVLSDSLFNMNHVWPPSAGTVYVITGTGDDGTESEGKWYRQGLRLDLNRVGEDEEGIRFATVERFRAPDLEQGAEVIYARLRVVGRGSLVPSAITLGVRGIAKDVDTPFLEDDLPSQRPLTENAVTWRLNQPMEYGSGDLPIYFSTPDLAPIVNEIVSGADWEPSGRTLTFLFEQDRASDTGANYLDIPDRTWRPAGLSPCVLEVCRTLEETFIAGPMLGRPTASSICINLMSLVDIDIYAEVGTTPGDYSRATPPLYGREAQQPIDLVIDGLEPNTLYYYRLRYRPAGNEKHAPDGGENTSGSDQYASGFEGSFHTARPSGSAFVFTIQADSHIVGGIKQNNPLKLELYDVALRNVLADRPDFHIDLGDFAHIELYGGVSVHTYQDALDRYLVQRRFLAGLSRSVPFFLVLGNHEGEEGWRLALDSDSIEVWGTLARKALIPNPYPDGFYTGGEDFTECCGLRESYYAWEWGDALFVVLDPFWYTTTMPHSSGSYPASDDAWDWTLGNQQYDWFSQTLQESDARWKFVLIHHMTGGVLEGHKDRKPYGRGGIVAARYAVDGRPTFEWGGEDSTGKYVFEAKRPDFVHGPVHQVMVNGGVDIFFHGHDHVFVHETLDGIVYQECPVPANPRYGDGFYSSEYYRGDKVANSGHLRVTVSPDSVRVDYVRSVLPENEPLIEDGKSIRNGDISYSYTIRK